MTKKLIDIENIHKILEHRKRYSIESGLLYINCEYNDKSGYNFNYGAQCLFALNERQKIYLIETTNKFNCRIMFLEILEHNKKCIVHL